MMTGIASRLILRLEHYTPLGAEDKQAMESVASGVKRFDRGDTLARPGESIDRIFGIVDGFACRYRLLPDGRRQIVAFMLPGDLCDTRSFHMPYRDHTIGALSTVDAVVFTRDNIRELESRSTLSRALNRNSVVHQCIAREWLVNVGHRTSFERLGHLLCEIFERLRIVGLVRDHSCEVPLTQNDLADTLALSAVHVNRTMMELRRAGLVTFHSQRLILHDPEALRRATAFDPGYLLVEKMRDAQAA
jgi:CRP-like cAMP-binding protein